MSGIGIAALYTRLGAGGGLDVSTTGLIEALADHGQQREFHVLVAESTIDYWRFRDWPSHVHIVTVYDEERPQPLAKRIGRYMRRSLDRPVAARSGEPYVARQLDGLNLDVLYYPRTVIFPLSVRTPCVLQFSDMQQEYYPEFFTKQELASRAATYRPSVEKAVHIIAPSHFTETSLIEKYSVPPGKITVLPHGISRGMRRVPADHIERVRIKYGLPPVYVYYPANPWQHKNHARLMAALSILRMRHGDCPWLVLSGRLPEERRDAMSLAIAAGVEDRVIDLSLVESGDMPALYSGARLLVFPSLFEGFGNPLVEAMACGCPIAAADTTSIAEITNGAAVLFDPFDPELMADAIHRLFEDADLRQILVARGTQQLSRFDWGCILPQLIAVLERSVDPNP